MTTKKKILKPVLVKWVQFLCPTLEAKPIPELARPLGRMGVNTAEFCKQFNARTESDGWKSGIEIPVRLYTYSDRTYKFEIRSPELIYLLNHRKFGKPYKLEDTDIGGGSGGGKGGQKAVEVINLNKREMPVGYIDVREIYEIAKLKLDQDSQIGDGSLIVADDETLESLAKKIAINCEERNVKVVQFGGLKIKPKMDRMFEPYYNIWTLYEDSSRFWQGYRTPFKWQNKQ